MLSSLSRTRAAIRNPQAQYLRALQKLLDRKPRQVRGSSRRRAADSRISKRSFCIRRPYGPGPATTTHRPKAVRLAAPKRRRRVGAFDLNPSVVPTAGSLTLREVATTAPATRPHQCISNDEFTRRTKQAMICLFTNAILAVKPHHPGAAFFSSRRKTRWRAYY